ncbi:MAG: hybrid sensor histidine kinase/response regulator [Cyanobacteria bacterium J083]|nr:MAG: hybrid sensor histidine kinase/response regulator [Cyanobacteria bacterium J083]
MTLSIAKLMLCETAGVTYALLIDAIERIVQPTDKQLQIFDDRKVLSWQTETAKHLIPIKQLSELVHYTRTPQNQAEFNENQQLGNKPILLVRRQKELLGLEVDKVLGEQELVIRPLGSAITPPNYIYGCSILKDSRLTLVVDAAALIKETLEDQNYLTQTNDYPSYAEVELLPPEEEVDESAQLLSQTLLIIDDSSSLRKTISLSLQKISNQVLQAENGFKGLEKLHQAESIKAIVCDLEMPQMNGFQFLQAIKNHPQFSQIPVVMLTTRDSDKHRKQAMDLGASAYLTKPYQEGELLSTITGLIKD